MPTLERSAGAVPNLECRSKTAGSSAASTPPPRQANRAIEQYRYHEAAQVLWQFFWHEFCDWYLELKKLRFQENSGSTRLAQRAGGLRNRAAPAASGHALPHRGTVAAAGDGPPKPAEIHRARAVSAVPTGARRPRGRDAKSRIIQEIVTLARTLRTESQARSQAAAQGALYCRTASLAIAQRHADAIQKLANVKLEFKAEAAPKADAIRSTVGVRSGARHPQGQRKTPRASRRRSEQLEKNIANSKRQLADEAFLAKAPAKVVDSIRAKLADYEGTPSCDKMS